jgi:hypothetical protein
MLGTNIYEGMLSLKQKNISFRERSRGIYCKLETESICLATSGEAFYSLSG